MTILVIIQLVVTTVHVILAISLILTIIIVMVRLLTLLLLNMMLYNLMSNVDECTLCINGIIRYCVNIGGSYLCFCFTEYHLMNNQETKKCLPLSLSLLYVHVSGIW